MNRKFLSVLIVLLTVFSVTTAFYPTVASAADTTYYVSSSTGDNSYDGKTQSTAWKDFTKLNTVTFQPGDTILFKRGDTWTNQTFYPKGNGNFSTGQWITVDAYGTGNKPVISSWSANPGAIMFSRTDFTGGWKIKNLKFYQCKMGIDVEKTSTTIASGLWVENCDFSDITGNNIGAATNTGFNDSVWCSEGLFLFFVDNATIKNCTFYQCDIPFDIRASSNALVDGCTVNRAYRGGIWISGYSDGRQAMDITVQNTVVKYAGYSGMSWGTAGIQLNGGTNIVIQDCEVAYTKNTGYNHDSVGIDYESDTVNCITRRTYIHDNDGSAFLFMENPSWGVIGKQTGSQLVDLFCANNGLRNTAEEPAFIRIWSDNNNNNIQITNCAVFKANNTTNQTINKVYDANPQYTDTYPVNHFNVSNNIIFKDDFSGSLSNWDNTQNTNTTNVPGTLFVTNNELMRCKNGSGWGNYSIEADVAVNAYNAGIVVRGVDSNNYYMFQFQTNGQIIIYKKVSGNWSNIKAVPITWTDTWQHVKIKCVGSTITTYFNNKQVDQFTDTTFSAGSPGFREYGTTESAYFDNFVVIGL